MIGVIYVECRVLDIVMPSVNMLHATRLNVLAPAIMLSVVMLIVWFLFILMVNVVMLSVIMLYATRLNVLAPAIMLSVVMLIVWFLFILMVNVVMLSVIMLIVIMQKFVMLGVLEPQPSSIP